MRGADTVVLITAAGANAAHQAQVAIECAKAAGVRKIVRLSAIKASADGPTDNTRQHAQTERNVRESELAYVLLRPQFFMQNLLGSATTVVREGKLYSAVDAGRIGMIDARDVADCIEQAVLRADYDGRAWELTGPESITHDAVAAALAEAVGSTLEYVRLSPGTMAESMRAFGANDWMVRLMADYMSAYRDGFGDFVTDAVETMTGRPPRGIGTFAREVFVPIASAFRSGPPTESA
jgi:NAD(P)H dehydrogenase (quinone)